MKELTESMTTWLAGHGIAEWLIPFIVSLFPLIELRGGIIAVLRRIPLKKSVPAIFLGLCLASAIMCVLCYGFPEVFAKMFG